MPKNANSLKCFGGSYLKIYKRHWVLSSLGSMWIECHTKWTTVYSSGSDAFVLLSSARTHCCNCVDSTLTCWNRKRNCRTTAAAATAARRVIRKSVKHIKIVLCIEFQSVNVLRGMAVGKLNVRLVCLGSTCNGECFPLFRHQLLNDGTTDRNEQTKHFRWLFSFYILPAWSRMIYFIVGDICIRKYKTHIFLQCQQIQIQI